MPTSSPSRVFRLSSRHWLSILCALMGLFLWLRLDTTTAHAAPNAVTWPPINLSLLEAGFHLPVGIVSPDDGTDRLFVVERSGKIQIIENGVKLATPFLDISDRTTVYNAPGCGECGLLGLAFPPDFAAAGYFFVYYTSADDRINGDTGDPDPTDIGDSVLARFHLTADPNIADPNSEEEILVINQPAKNHNGGQILFGPDGYLYLGLGDGGGSGDPFDNAQDPASLLGKILRLEVGATLTYTVPATNPYTTTVGYRDEIWAMGLRNPWRFGFDRETGNLYIGDVGQLNIEEINFIPAADIPAGGFDFGWSVLEGDVCYPPSGPQDCDRTGFIAPVATYDHSLGDCSVTGGYVYRAPGPAQAPIYLYADYCTGRLLGLQRDGDTWATKQLDDLPFQITSFGDDAAGNIYVVAYSNAIYVLDETITGLSATNDGPKQVNESINFSTTITGSTAISYTWDFGDGNTGSGIAPTHTYTTSGIYTATVVAANDTNSMTATTTVYIGDVVVEVFNNFYSPSNITVAPGSKVVWVLREGTHSVTADNGEFNQPLGTNWPPFMHTFDELPATTKLNTASPNTNINASVTINYYCTAHGAPGGVNMAGSVTVTDEEPPITGLTASNDGPTILGAPTVFTATITSGSVTTYTWDFGDGSPLVSSSGITTSHTYTATGSYTATVIAANATVSATASTVVTVYDESNPPPITGLTASNDGPTTLGTSTTFTATISSGVVTTYTWDFGDGNTDSGIAPTHTYTATGSYTATVIAANATTSATASTVVTVQDAPSTPALGGLSASNNGPTTLGSPTLLTANLITGTADAYTWDFGDGSVLDSSSHITATHTYTATGLYTVTVVATNTTSALTATTTVYVGDAVVEVTSNAFTPRDVTVPVGGTVVWVLREGFHSVTADDASFNQPAGTNWPPFMHTFDSAGLNPYYCIPHGGPGGQGMSGTVRVGNDPDSVNDLNLPYLWGTQDN